MPGHGGGDEEFGRGMGVRRGARAGRGFDPRRVGGGQGGRDRRQAGRKRPPGAGAGSQGACRGLRGNEDRSGLPLQGCPSGRTRHEWPGPARRDRRVPQRRPDGRSAIGRRRPAGPRVFRNGERRCGVPRRRLWRWRPSRRFPGLHQVVDRGQEPVAGRRVSGGTVRVAEHPAGRLVFLWVASVFPGAVDGLDDAVGAGMVRHVPRAGQKGQAGARQQV